jgi:hypothetical protein
MAGTPNRWYKELRKLRESPSLRNDLSEAGRAVAAGLRLEPNAWRWMEVWEEAYKIQHSRG